MNQPLRAGDNFADMNPKPARGHTAAMCLIFGCYALTRVLEVRAGPPAHTNLVAMEVLSALGFALVDGARTLTIRGILVLVAICAVVGNAMETLGVATGIPYGDYHFTELMGPRLLAVPILLGLAYIGMAYAAWMLAGAIVGRVSAVHPRIRVVTVPLAAAFIMVAWDLAQDPVWSTLLRAWIWRDGGSWFGVPVSNYCGWFVTIFLICLLFAVYMHRRPAIAQARRSALPSLVFYVLCAAGNVFQIFTRRAIPEVADGSGRLWRVDDILAASAVVSLLVMGAFAAMAWARITEKRSATD